MTVFWLEDITQLVQDPMILPESHCSLEEQLNAVTRGIVILWVFLYLINYKHHSIFLLLSIIFIIILYYIERNTMKESYTSHQTTNGSPASLPLDDWKYLPKGNKLKIQKPEQYRFCKTEKPIVCDQRFQSNNQALVGPPNPKTLQKNYVVAPSHATDYWMPNYRVPSQINDSTHEELFQSGYIGTSECDKKEYSQEMFPQHSTPLPPVYKDTLGPERIPNHNGQLVEGYSGMYPSDYRPSANQPHTIVNEKGLPGDFIPYTYDPSNLNSNLPVNLPAGKCEKGSEFNQYNQNLFTQNLGQSSFTRSEIIEPIQSNIGISFTQQFPPVTRDKTENGTMYTAHDPRLMPYAQPEPARPDTPTMNNVYDPRSYGYGTSYRSYIDELTGQPRFYYDDVEAIRKPNYLTRSNIDHIPGVQTYGSITHVSGSNRELAQQNFLDSTLQQRGDLQERLMRKYNNEIGWQRRQAPLRRDSHNGFTRTKA